jgi:NhaA family Na+:H+ antiporter
VKTFLRQESASGFVLIAAAIAALLWANSGLAGSYQTMLHARLGMSAHDWVNDALMALFFLLVALEIKRETRGGELSSFGTAALPAIAAIGGILVPSAICFAFVGHDPALIKGWAIPAATDIAFALAALTVAGPTIPPALKMFLTALAVIDDLVAILIIAIFYTAQLSAAALLAAIGCFAVLLALNRLSVKTLIPYLVIGAVMWYFVLQSGVHATLAGVALALVIPTGELPRLERRLHPYVAFGVVPLFGLFNAGVSFSGIEGGTLLGALPLGIAVALFFGKQAGIFGFSWLAVKTGLAPMPKAVNWPMLYGVALLGGIGFTMSLFIATLAFADAGVLGEAKIGIFAGSALSALAGCLVLKATGMGTPTRRNGAAEDLHEASF